ncbi:hypothetical protein [Thalassotalea sp. SU-HH00458]|uniref:hypothetical protein n=1 Tax=Thalassotalea sp. SU-HH00458 TaxID=3127657 RepID=UPI003105A4E5
MKTFILNEESFNSVKQFCRSVITAPELKVRMLPQCFELEKVGMCALRHKMLTVLRVNGIECIKVPKSLLESPDALRILSLLFDLNLKLSFENSLSKLEAEQIPTSILRRYFRD